MRHEGEFRASDLRLSTDETPVEHIGGPNDGELLPANMNGRRRNGLYVIQSTDEGRPLAQIYVPD